MIFLKKTGSFSILPYVFVSLIFLFFLAIFSSIFFVVKSSEEEAVFFAPRDPNIKKFEKRNVTLKNENQFVLKTKGCRIRQTQGIFGENKHISENGFKSECPAAITSINSNAEVFFELQDSMLYANLNCCSSYWTSSKAFSRRTRCQSMDNMDSVIGKEFLQIKCCYTWMKMVTKCQKDIHANIPLNPVVQRKVAFWNQRMPHFKGLPPSILLVRFRVSNSHLLPGNSADEEKLSEMGFVPLSGLFYRGARSNWPFYTKANRTIFSKISNPKYKVVKIKSTISPVKTSLVNLFSSMNEYVTFNVVGNRSLLGEVNKLKFDYDFAKFAKAVDKGKCIGKLSLEEYALEYASRLISKFPMTPFFGNIFLNEPSKNSKDLFTHFLQTIISANRQIKEKTAIIIIEDPEIQSKSPSQVLIRVPDSIAEENVYTIDVLSKNRNRLVTASDLHQTFIGIFKMACHSRRFDELDYRRKCSVEIQSIPKGYNLIKSVIPSNRTCSSAGIQKQLCPCLHNI